MKVRVVRKVTIEHGKAFADAVYDGATGTAEVYAAVFHSGVIEFPPESDPVAQMNYHDIVDEITNRTLDAVRPALAEEFVRIANEVFDRERRPPRVATMRSRE